MPKRIFASYLNKREKIRRKSIACDETSKNHPNNLEDELDKDDIEIIEDPKQIKKQRYSKLNRNSEIERLLIYNSTSLYLHMDHCEFPTFNVGLWPQEGNELLTTYPSVAFSVPRPIYVADKQCEKVDLCYKRVMNKEFHKNRMNHTRTAYKNALKKKVLRSSEKDGIYHISVFDAAERVFLQPDPYFHKSYDHYYTGGNLNTLPQSGNLVHAGGEQLRTFAISEFPINQDYTTSSYLQNVAKHELSEDSEIFEVYPLLTSPDSSRQNSFIARQRNLVTFNYLNDNKEIKTISQFRTKSTPFISFAQSERERDNFIITTKKQHVRLYDLGTSVPKLVKLYEISPTKPSISWNTVKPWRENTFLYANEKQFLLIDTRTTPEQWLETVILAQDRYGCDHISSVLPSDFNNLFYVATNHKLHCMDIRYLEKFAFNDSQGAICRWSHQLRYAPLMMDSFRLRQNEYVALSSPLAGDLHICQLSRERNSAELTLQPLQHVPKHIYSSVCLPYQPPTLLEAYESARLAGKCLRPEANLEARLKCCTTGLKFYDSALNDTSSAIALLLTSNSNGDIFAQSLSKREKGEKEEVRCDKNSDEIMAEFESTICAQKQPPLNFTDIKNMRSLRKIFLCKSLSSKPKYDFDAMADEYSENEETTANNENITNSGAPRRKLLHLGRWQKSVSTLHSYKDALASDLLSIWGVEVEDEKNIRLGNLEASLNIKPDPSVKVKDWLSTNLTPNPPMLTIPAQQIAKYNVNSTLNIEDIHSITQTQNTTIDFDNAVHSTQIMDNTVNVSALLDTSGFELQIQDATKTTILEKKKKKSKKYIKGF